jgi:hypothetical protein
MGFAAWVWWRMLVSPEADIAHEVEQGITTTTSPAASGLPKRSSADVRYSMSRSSRSLPQS